MTHNTDLNITESRDSPKKTSPDSLAYQVAVLSPQLAFEIGLGKRKIRADWIAFCSDFLCGKPKTFRRNVRRWMILIWCQWAGSKLRKLDSNSSSLLHAGYIIKPVCDFSLVCTDSIWFIHLIKW